MNLVMTEWNSFYRRSNRLDRCCFSSVRLSHDIFRCRFCTLTRFLVSLRLPQKTTGGAAHLSESGRWPAPQWHQRIKRVTLHPCDLMTKTEVAVETCEAMKSTFWRKNEASLIKKKNTNSGEFQVRQESLTSSRGVCVVTMSSRVSSVINATGFLHIPPKHFIHLLLLRPLEHLIQHTIQTVGPGLFIIAACQLRQVMMVQELEFHHLTFLLQTRRTWCCQLKRTQKVCVWVKMRTWFLIQSAFPNVKASWKLHPSSILCHRSWKEHLHRLHFIKWIAPCHSSKVKDRQNTLQHYDIFQVTH